MQDEHRQNRLFRAAAAFRRNLKAMKIPPDEEAKFLDSVVRGTLYAVIPVIFLMIWFLS